MKEVSLIERDIQKRLPIGSRVGVAQIKNDFLTKGYSEAAIMKALMVLGRREVLKFSNQNKYVFRQSA